MKTAVLLSGGVDSSVALRLAQTQGGGDLTAFYLKIWLEEELAFLGDCPWEEDLTYARAVCAQANVPLEVVALQSEYQERVVGHALGELKRGRTPSPDILCNQLIKFGLFFEKVGPGFDKVVSGHYAQVAERGGRFLLQRSPDPVKDQTYFLSRLDQKQLRRIWFPIGHLRKSEVRQLAQKWELPNCARRDSQGICFLGKISYPQFVRFHLGERAGDIIDIDTQARLGQHQGVWFHTIGQRQGLGLGGGPWYVVQKDLETNRLLVAHGNRYREHARSLFSVIDLHWISGEPGAGALQVKLRHSPHLENCSVRPLPGGRWEVVLAQKDQGVAPGQAAVFYQGDCCLGAGTIE
jgi:tRNA-specific 2-thiouridylase